MGKFIDLTGQKFGRLTVISRAENSKHGKVRWNCKCDCENEVIRNADSLRKNNVHSCGCYRIEKLNEHSFTHGKSETRLNNIWRGMKQRCLNPNNPAYKNYGGRGIMVCEKWQEFQPFYDWAMANGYKDDLTIDRINVSGNYEPSNCRWADTKTQSNNTRRSHYISYKGKTMTLTQWANKLNMNKGTLTRRLNSGWSIEEAFTKQLKGTYTFNGKTQSLEEWADELNIKHSILYQRIYNKGLTVEEAFTKPPRPKVYTYNGKTLSLKEWSDELKISYVALQDRVYKRKWSIERALSIPIRKRNK